MATHPSNAPVLAAATHRRPRARTAFFALLVAAGVGLACTPSRGPHPRSPRKETKAQAAIRLDLPRPLPIPADPPAHLFVRNPLKAESKLKSALEDPNFSLRASLTRGLAPRIGRANAQRVASVCDLARPVHAIALANEVELLSAYLDPSRRDALAHWLASLPAAGKFGARTLPGPKAKAGKGAWLIWTGPSQDRIYLAPSLRGLSTAHSMHAPKSDLVATLLPQKLGKARRDQLDLPPDLLKARAAGSLQALSVDLKLRPDPATDLSALQLSAPTMPRLLSDPSLVWSASSTWTQSSAKVREILNQVEREVSRLPFLIRPTAQSLQTRLIATMQQWNGQGFAGLDDQQSLRLAFGVQDANASEQSTLGLLQAGIPNLSLMRSLASDVPSARLLQQRARINNQKIHELILSDISSHLPQDLHSLLSRRRQLHIAMSWSPASSTMMVTVGPSAVPSMLTWIQASASEALFSSQRPPAQVQGRTTLPALLLWHWAQHPADRPSMAQLLRARPATPGQDYAISLTQTAADQLHAELRLPET